MTPLRSFTAVPVIFGLAVAVGLFGPPPLAAQTATHWNGTSGNWTSAASWSGGVVPNNGTPAGSTYDAFIDAVGTYTVTLNSSSSPTSITVNNLTLNDAGATLTIAGGGTLAVANNATLTAGTLQLTGGTLSGGSFSTTGGVIRFDGSSTNILNNLTLVSAGVIDLSPTGSFLQLQGSTALPAGGYTIGQSSTLVFNQATTVTGVALTLGGNGAGVFADGGNTVTVPSGSSVTVGSANITTTLGVNRVTANAGTVLVNQGTVGFAAGATNSTLNISTFQGNGAFQNSGTVQANLSGDTVTFGIHLSNLAGGQIVASTGTVTVNAGLNNAGTLVVSGGILNLASAFTTAQLGAVNHTAGTVNIAATMTNTGATLALTDAGPNPTGSFTLAGGTISGGTITVAGSAKLLANGSNSNILNNVTLGSTGVVDLSPTGSFLQLQGSTALPAGSYTIGSSSTLVFNQATTVTGVALTLGGNGAGVFADGGNTVTVPSGSSVTVGSANITTTLGVNRVTANTGTVLANQGTVGFAAGATNSTLNISTFQGNGAFQNSGTVQANLSGDTVTFGVPLSNLAGGQVIVPTGGTVTVNAGLNNAGTLVVSGGTLNLASAFTTAQLGAVNHTAGTVNIAATMTNTGATLALTDAGPNPTGSFTLAGGTISGGTITVAGSAKLLANGSGSNILNNVTLGSAGVIDLSPTGSLLQLQGSTALPAGSYTIGSSSALVFNQATTVTGVALTLGGNGAGVFADGGNTVTIGSTSSVSVGSASVTTTLGVNRVTANAGTVLVNQGTVGFAAGATNSALGINTFQGNGTFQNSGTVQANLSGDTVTFGVPLSNLAGGQVIVPTGGTVTVNAGLNNAGTLVVSGGTLNLASAFTTAQLGAVNHTAGTVNIAATMTNTGATLALTDAGPNPTGSFTLAGGTISGGTITVAGSAKLLANGSGSNILNNVTLGSAGVIDLSPTGSFLQLQGSTALPAGSYTIGISSALVFNQATTVTGVALTLGGNGAGVFADGGNTVTIGSTSSVSVGSANITTTLGVNRVTANAGTVLVNQGTVGFAAGATNSTLNISTFQGNGAFQNSSTVQANLSGDIVNISVPTFTNTGTLAASGGGTVSVSSTGTNFTNFGASTLTGGTYSVGTGSTINLGTRTVSTIAAGTTVTLDGVSSTFAALNPVVTNQGTFNLTGGHSLTVIGGTLTNTGVLTVGNTTATTLTGNVINNSGGTLQGSGTVAGTVAINTGSTILPGPSPGNGVGILTVGNTTLVPGGQLVFQIADWNAAPVAGTDYNQLAGSVGSTLNLSALTSGSFTIAIDGLSASNAIGAVPGFNPGLTRSWTIAQFSNDLSATNPNVFTLDTNNFTPSNPGGGPFVLTLGSNGTLFLTFTPVPEPSCICLAAALAAGAVGGLRRHMGRPAR